MLTPGGTAYHGEAHKRIENELRERIAKEFETSGRQFWGNADIAAEIRRNGHVVSRTSYGSYPPSTEEGPCGQ